MADPVEKKSDGFVSLLFKKGLLVAATKIVEILLPISIVVLFLAWMVDKITASLRIDTPFGPIALPQTTFFEQALSFLQQIFFGFIGSLVGVVLLPAAIIIGFLLVRGFLNWKPEPNEPSILERIKVAIYRSMHAGARKGGELTAKGAKRVAAEMKKKRIEAGKCPSCGVAKAGDQCAFCGTQFPQRRLQLKAPKAPDEFTILGRTFKKKVKRPAVQPPDPAPAFPSPPETLTPVLPIGEGSVEIAEEEFPIEAEVSEGEQFEIEEEVR